MSPRFLDGQFGRASPLEVERTVDNEQHPHGDENDFDHNILAILVAEGYCLPESAPTQLGNIAHFFAPTTPELILQHKAVWVADFFSANGTEGLRPPEG
jgi:hypothetical protein